MNELQWRESVEAVKRGDKKAFELIYRETERPVYYTCLKLLANEEAARDVMQDTFMTALQKLDLLDDGANFTKWIKCIAANKCRDSFRKVSNDSLDEQLEQGTEFKDDESFIPEEYVTDETKRKIIMDIINRVLSDVQRQAIIMYYYDDMSLEEIAEVTGDKVKTVSARLCSARDKIKEAVLIYERDNDDRLHAIVPIPILTQILFKEASSIGVPDILPTLLNTPLFTAAAAASASTISTSVIAGGSKMTGFFTGKVIAAIAAGVIAVGGTTAAVVLSKNSDKDTSSKTSVSATSNDGKGGSDSKGSSDSKGGSDGKGGAIPDSIQTSGSYYKIADNNYVILPPNYGTTKNPHKVSVFCDVTANENPYYGVLTASTFTTSSDKKMTTAEVRDKSFQPGGYGYGHDLLEEFNDEAFIKKVNVEKTETITIKGKEFIKESGTMTLSNFDREYPAVYSSLFGKIDYLYDNTAKTPDKDVPVAFLALSTNVTDAMKQEMTTNIDNIAKSLAMTDEAEVKKLADSQKAEDRVFFSEKPGTTAPNGTVGTMRNSGCYTILQPQYWWITRGFGYSDSQEVDELWMKSPSGDKAIYMECFSEPYKNPGEWAEKEAEFLKNRPDDYEDVSIIPEFTLGNYKVYVVKFKTQAVYGQPKVWSFHAVINNVDSSKPCAKIKMLGIDYEDDVAQDIIGTLDMVNMSNPS